MSAAVENAAAAAPLYRFTFGHYLQKDDWSDIRSLTWRDVIDVLTTHTVGPKAGTCIVPAVFSGTHRRKAEAARIDVAMLDSDGGATLDEIRATIAARGWAAIIASTHSHLTTRTTIKRLEWERYRQEKGEAASAEAFLVARKGALPRVAAGARLAAEIGDQLVIEHAPCPKFRVIFPLLRPWRAASYRDARAASSAWRARVEALAAALGLAHDQACTDTSRLFYLPRRPAVGPEPETAVLEGKPCDIFALPHPDDDGPGGAPKAARAQRSQRGEDYTDPENGEVLDLAGWARSHGRRFLISQALRARSPAMLRGIVTDGTKHHIRCPNESEHTQSGEDAATFVMDPGTGSEAKGFVIHCRHAHCGDKDRLFFLRRMLEQHWLRIADLTEPDFLAPVEPDRLLIRMAGGELKDIVDLAEDALLRADLGLYQRGPFVVRRGRVMITVSDGREVSGQRAVEVKDCALAEALTQAAIWERFDGRSREWVRIDAPPKIAKTYLQRNGHWRLPVLAGIINAPTLRPDGSLLAVAGYDASTGLLFDPCGAAFPPIRAKPTRAHAEKALALIKALIATFPFVSEADRAVALSTILTSCIRRSLRTAPMHAYTAPTAGTGKSKLVDLASIIATGREAGVIGQGKTEEELEKRLGALLLASEVVIAIDNCEAPLGGEFLCSMLTQPVVRPRILGKSEAPELPSNAVVTATGNNLVLVGDLTRRALLCRLDAKMERPELRRFAVEPVEEAKRQRGLLIAAALTVLSAYHIAGRPGQPDALGSFEEWSGWVRGALLWLGEADPVDTMKEVRATDPRLEELRAVMSQWKAVIGSGAASVREIIERAVEPVPPTGPAVMPRAEFRHPDFREALLAVAGKGGAISGGSLGRWLGNNADRIIDGQVIRRGTLSGGIQRWVLESAGAARPAAAA